MPASDDELRFHREHRRLTLDRHAASGGDGKIARSVKVASAFYAQIITHPVEADYSMPEHFARTVGKQERRVLAELLAELREFRTQTAGLAVGDAQVLYNGDPYAMLLGQEFEKWMTAHARSRLAKPSPRDSAGPWAKYVRLQDEFVYWLEALVLVPSSGHTVPLTRVHKRIAWEVHRGTWGGFAIRDARGAFVGVDAGDANLSAAMTATMEAQQWHREGIISGIAAEYPELAAGVGGAEATAELACVVSDLMEVRGLLARTFVPSEHVVEVSPGIYAGWNWEVGHVAGTVNLGSDRRELAGELDRGILKASFALDFAGGVREMAMPWLEFGPRVADWALGVVRPIHEHLVALWDQAPRPAPVPSQAASGGTGDAESIAAACETLALADDRDEHDEGPRLRVPTVRSESLLRLLERAFSVEVKQGKGSEITLYRVGGRKHVLGHHKRNTHVASRRVQIILRALDIGSAEFCEAAGR